MICIPQFKLKLVTAIRVKKNLQSLICVVAVDFEVAKDFLCTILHITFLHISYYKFSSIIRAVDVCFKIFQVFNLKYPIQSILVCTFIQHYFYDINFESDVKNSSLMSLVSDLSH